MINGINNLLYNNIVTFLDKREGKRICKKILRMTKYYINFEPFTLNKNDLIYWETELLIQFIIKLELNFQKLLMKVNKWNLFLEYPNFRK